MDKLENTEAQIFLKSGREKSLKNRHPWIFSGAINRTEGDFQPGDIVSVYSSDGKFAAKGFMNPKSQIFGRVLTFEDEPVDYRFFLSRVQKALSFRKELMAKNTDAYRLVNSDGDLLPGLIVDKYASSIVLQFNSLGMSRLKAMILKILTESTNPDIIIERTEGKSLSLEGLDETSQVIAGEAPVKIQISENGVKFWVDILSGQKTGFFLDQRENRQRIANLCKSKRLLNCFSYTGGFSINAALKGAKTTSVEYSDSAQKIAKENFTLNLIDPSLHQFVTGDVFNFLRAINDKYEAVVLDPPAFIKKKQHLQKGSRGYKDINRLAMKNIESGGFLLTCSCSYYVNWDLFQKIIYAAAKEAKRNIQIVGRFGAPPDHPVSVFHPEGEYLKSFLLRVFD